MGSPKPQLCLTVKTTIIKWSDNQYFTGLIQGSILLSKSRKDGTNVGAAFNIIN